MHESLLYRNLKLNTSLILCLQCDHESRKLTGRTYAAIVHIPLAKLHPDHLMSFHDTLAQSGVRANQSYHAKPKLKEFMEKAGLAPVSADKLCRWTRGRTSKVINGAGLRHKNAALLAAALHQPTTRLSEVPRQEPCLHGNTLPHYHRFISSVLSTAIQWQVIFATPCERVAPPKQKRKKYNIRHLRRLYTCSSCCKMNPRICVV